MGDKIGVAVFGVGRAGSIHLENLIKNPRAQVKYVVDMDVESAKSKVEKFKASSYIKVLGPDQADTVFNDDSVQGVLICTYTEAHEQYVCTALQHGKAVMCEKPVSNDINGIVNCYKEAEKCGKPLLCAFNRRFDPSLVDMARRIKDGEVGTIYTVKTTARDYPLPGYSFLKMSGGIFHDCGIHDLDYVCWMVGEYPSSVFVQASVHDKEIEKNEDVDTVSIMLKFPSKILCTIDLSRHSSYGYDQRCEIFGKKGMLVCENQSPTSNKFYTSKGATEDMMKGGFRIRYAESYANCLDHFLDLTEGICKEARTTLLSSVQAARMASACELSHKTGLPVELSSIPMPEACQPEPTINGY